MAKTKKQGENSACRALFERAYYSSGYGIYERTLLKKLQSVLSIITSYDSISPVILHWVNPSPDFVYFEIPLWPGPHQTEGTSFTQQCWENDGSLVNNVGAMHRRLSNNVWTNDRRFHIQCWLNDRRLVEFTSLLYRVSPVCKLDQGVRKWLIITYSGRHLPHIQWFYDIFRILRMSILGEAPFWHDPWHAPTIINVAKNGTNSFGYKFYEKSRSFVTFEMHLDSIRSFLRTSGLLKPPPGMKGLKMFQHP